MILADTGAMIALIDRNDSHHARLAAAYDEYADEWIVPWCVLPEIDDLLAEHVSRVAQETFLEDLADRAFEVLWGSAEDLEAAARIDRHYKSLRLGLVDAVVIALAGRHRVRAIATLDLRHFGAVKIPGSPQLWPRDLPRLR